MEVIKGTRQHTSTREQPCKWHSCIVLVRLCRCILQLVLIAIKRQASSKEKQMRFGYKESKGLCSETTMKASLLPVFASVSECEWEHEAFVNTKTEAGRSRMLPSRDTGSEVNAVSLSGRCAWVQGV